MKELRCPYCNKLLLKISGTYELEIKCNKCKEILLLKDIAKKTNK